MFIIAAISLLVVFFSYIICVAAGRADEKDGKK